MDEVGAERVTVFFDRDDTGKAGQAAALDLLRQNGFQATGFDWGQSFPTPERGGVPIPATIHDPGDFASKQLQWMRGKSII